ncbi:TIGR03118 family protein [Roseateles sp.]|uniref:TIGR03118 family protein n=1 Tax=Roseateles sp. TaxID=1971397 RepID=UPI003D0CFB40
MLNLHPASRITLAGLMGLLASVASQAAPSALNAFVQTNLVANSAKYQPTALIDPDLVNPWGIALRPPGIGGHIWTSNAGTGTTSTYIGDVNGLPLQQDGLKLVPIVTSARDRDPFATGSDGVAQVTGQVYNAASDVAGQPLEFKVRGAAVNYNNGQSAGVIEGAAKFVFVTMDGTINAWRSGTNPGMLEAVVVKDYSLIQPADHGLRVAPGYTGVAMTTEAWRLDAQGQKLADNRLYAADFANGLIQTFDNQWQDVTVAGSFARPDGLAASYHPFNVQVMGDRVYVAWAENSFEIDEPTEEIPGAGFGRIAAYDRDGRLLQDFSEHSLLNAPWGMVIAPQSFGAFAGALLVANFGDGTIAGYDVQSGASLGYLRDAQGEVISIDGIWGLTFGNGVALGDANALYFTAGPDEERDGLLGKLELAPVPEPGTVALMSLGLLGLTGLRGFQARHRRQA